MNVHQLPWREFVESLPSQNPNEHLFRVINWLFARMSYHVRNSGLIKFLNSIEALAIVVAVVALGFDLSDQREERKARREEREARRLAAVTNVYATIQDVVERPEEQSGRIQPNRIQMIALETLYEHSMETLPDNTRIDERKYLVAIHAPGVPFSLPRNTYYSGCEAEGDPLRVVLKGVDMNRATLEGAGFSVADLSGANLIFSHLNDIKFDHACLRGANLLAAELNRANLSYADLTDANLSFGELRNAVLSDADLSDADLTAAELRNADLRNADLSDADLSDADLSDADLSDADLSDADLTNANLRGAELRNANLTRAVLLNVSGLTQTQLNNACIEDELLLGEHLENGLVAPPVREDCRPAE